MAWHVVIGAWGGLGWIERYDTRRHITLLTA
jgi:hypothetical protein